ncbi:MAG: 2-amino-4-hydroxy-6-hydroxymethyldihydropteridine diphosphokinase [Clostridiales bacterium]|nr:2-amino-4-hydroxy-6-hydroxymethyldihydropteridine diphosphokinase [Clostridiales bacterium]
MQKIYIKGLEIFAFHGVNPEEKADGQKFILDITLYADLTAACASDELRDTVNYAAVRKTVQRVMTGDTYDLIERAASLAADAVLAEFERVEQVKILLKKPDAPMNAVFDYVAIEITKNRSNNSPAPASGPPSVEDGHVAIEITKNRSNSSPAPASGRSSVEDEQEQETVQTSPEADGGAAEKAEPAAGAESDSVLAKGKNLLRKLKGPDYRQAYIALGSNMGDKSENLNRAVWALASIPGVKVSALSKVYETKPVGFARQENFYNAVIRVETTLSPRALLGACLGVEAGMGRIRGRKNGPRVIDLDLLLYEGKVCRSEELTLPHPRMEERAFVLSPLCDILQDPYYLGCLKRVGRDGVKTSGASLIKP